MVVGWLCVVLTFNMTRMNVKQLISLVKLNPALWDQKHDDYNNKIYLKQLWEEIAEKMDHTAEVCKLKWRSLRDVYRRELKKYQSRLNDPSISDKNLPRWYYFKSLQFLTEHLTGLESVAESPREHSDDYFESFYVKSEPDLLDDEEITLEVDDDVVLTLSDAKLQNDQDDSKSLKYFPDSSRKSDYCFRLADSNQLEEIQFDRSVKHRDSSKKAFNLFQEDRGTKRARFVESNNDRDSDSDYHFLMSLLPFLKEIPQHRKMFVRTKIQNVFCEEIEAQANSS